MTFLVALSWAGRFFSIFFLKINTTSVHQCGLMKDLSFFSSWRYLFLFWSTIDWDSASSPFIKGGGGWIGGKILHEPSVESYPLWSFCGILTALNLDYDVMFELISCYQEAHELTRLWNSMKNTCSYLRGGLHSFLLISNMNSTWKVKNQISSSRDSDL